MRSIGLSLTILLLLSGCNLNLFPEQPTPVYTPVTPFLPPTVTAVPSATGSSQSASTPTVMIPVVTDTPAPPTATPTASHTPQPTATNTDIPPTQTLIPTEAIDSQNPDGAHVGQGMGGLRLRQFPDATRGTIMLTLKEFTPLEVQGKTTDNAWVLVKIPEGFSGWVSSQYVVGMDINQVAVISDPQPVPYVAPTAPPNAPSVTGNVTGGARTIYQRGQTMGNRRNVFTTIGDSITDTPYFLRQFVTNYHLADYGYLLPVLQYFMTVNDLPGTPFNNLSLSTRQGWSTVTILDPGSANPVQCQPGETPVSCELRVRKPSVALILIGTNDVPVSSVEDYRPRLQRVIELCIEAGVVPVLSTLPHRMDLPERVAQYNEVIRATARQYDIPLWDLYEALRPLPNMGIDPDGVHLSIPPGGAASTTDFSADNLQYGTVIRNLTALQVLNTLLQQVMN